MSGPLGGGELARLRALPLADYAPRPVLSGPVTEVERPWTECVDVHNHLGRWLSGDGGWMVPDVAELLAVMDGCGVRCVVNLDGRVGRDLEENLERYDQAHPGRFLTFAQLDWGRLREPDGTDLLVADLRRAAAAGARGLKVWKDLGLTVTDGGGALVRPDDPRLAPVFAEAGALGLPVLIHTADPLAFFEPPDAANERLEEILANPDWSFAAPHHPSARTLLGALESLVAAQPDTVFIGAHAGCAEDLGWVGSLLERYPNFHIDIAGRMAELGRRPRAARALIRRFPERVLFGTDAFPVHAADYRLYYRFLESGDECFPYAPGERVPPQGRWDVSALELPEEVLGGLYHGNAARLLGL
ncbi:amidohydrolase [Streptomyces sp. N2-109]|uniref:Amidohydrolase n=1 Tax=Streptomyces gossypii TaxID=2883101 RepID=A0ABT2K232_9ACTN|nr:amidohydrolase [Streptomyces gossypii]MCT2594151.1 amidohydrolase [Streptomyces gossypii]